MQKSDDLARYLLFMTGVLAKARAELEEDGPSPGVPGSDSGSEDDDDVEEDEEETTSSCASLARVDPRPTADPDAGLLPSI